MTRLVGLCSGTDQLIDHPGYFDLPQQEIGLTHLVGFGDYELSPATRRLNPMPSGSAEHAPARGSDHGHPMRQAMEIAHARGLKVLCCTSTYHGGDDRYDELCMKETHGRPASRARRPAGPAGVPGTVSGLSVSQRAPRGQLGSTGSQSTQERSIQGKAQ